MVYYIQLESANNQSRRLTTILVYIVVCHSHVIKLIDYPTILLHSNISKGNPMNLKPISILCLFSSVVLASHIPTTYAANINEIRIDQPSSDNDEYFELKGDANESLSGLSYIVIGDGSGGSGSIESVTDLDGQLLDANGLFFVAKSSFTLGTPNLVANFSFENSDNVTHMLVAGFTGRVGDDIDIDDDGVIDNAPYANIVDSVALKENDNGELLYSTTIIGPDGSFVPGHSLFCDDGWKIGLFDPIAVNAIDTPGAENTCSGSGGNNGADPIELSIPTIQSNLDSSPFDGQAVITTGIVTADFQAADQLRGFYLQDAVGDNDLSTSDGIFVFTPSGNNVNVGDEVQLTGDVDEFFGLTELTNVRDLSVLSSNNLVQPTYIRLPETINGELEQYEGMLVEVVSPMTVTQNFFLSRFGQLTLSSANDQGVSGRLLQPTNVFPAASQERVDLAANNERRLLVLDDGQDISGFGDNPEPVPYIGSPPTVLRSGDRVSNLIGIIDYGRINPSNPPVRDYRLQPTVAPVFTISNPREATPQSTNGELNVASFNVLNYFSTVDGNGNICGPQANQGCRGADSESELARQRGKIVSALRAMDADIVGLIEIENNGYQQGSAIRQLVDALNATYGETTYQIAQPEDLNALGGDAIAVGFIYKPLVVTPIGVAATLTTGAFDQTLDDGGRSRPPLAVSFEKIDNGEVFTTVVNHFKSKRPASQLQNNGNDDQGDGQGSWNMRRTEAANDLSTWLASKPTNVQDDDVLIIGDLNAYAKEDPMLALQANGFVDLIQQFKGDTGYSFVFDGLAGSLDQALSSESLAEQVSGVVEWHINTDEPPVIDYNEDFNPAGYYNEDPFRSSDHDPVIVGLNLLSVPADSDQDGIIDDRDQCIDTPLGRPVDINGCSVEQTLTNDCEPLFAQSPRKYLRCVFKTAVKARKEGLLTRRQSSRIYYRAVLRVIYARYFSLF